MIPGFLLVVSSGSLFWRSFTEKRVWSHLGFAVMALGVMLSAFRRFVYTPGVLFGQIGLDHTVVAIFCLGSLCVVIDRAVQLWTDWPPEEKRSLKEYCKKLLWPMAAVPLAVLLMSAMLISWNGEQSNYLTLEQSIEAINHGDNVPAAAARLMDIAEQAVRKAKEAQDAEALRIVAHRSEAIREALR